jgi:hypothetical protein
MTHHHLKEKRYFYRERREINAKITKRKKQPQGEMRWEKADLFFDFFATFALISHLSRSKLT